MMKFLEDTMATLSFVEKVCYICGSVNRYGEASMFSINSAVGLDGHPGNLTPLYTAINICPNCHYAAPDISQGDNEIKLIIKDESYLSVASNLSVNEHVRKYIAWALIQNKLGKQCEAARVMLCATWLADQYKDENVISQCRRKAIELMSSCRSSGGNFEISRGKEIVTIVDLYRREGQFDDALDICIRAFESEHLSEDDEFLLRYEEKLCLEKNRSYATNYDAEKRL